MIQVVNPGQVSAAFALTAAKLKKGEDVVERGGAQIAARLAQGFAPKRTGRLAASIKASDDEVSAGADYAGYQNYGTAYVAATRFMEQAREAGEPLIYALGTKTFSAVVA